MEYQTDIQLKQIKDQMALLVERQKTKRKNRCIWRYTMLRSGSATISHTTSYEAEDGSFKLFMVGPKNGKRQSAYIYKYCKAY